MTTLHSSRNSFCAIFFSVLMILAQGNAVLAESKNHPHDEKSGQEKRHKQNDIELTSEQIAFSGIELVEAKAEKIREILSLYGQIVPNDRNVQSITARFQGVVTHVGKNMGDKVRKGQTLAQVESNNSLKAYPIKSAIDGIITQHHANVGEQTSDKILFQVADFSTVWADLSVFPKDRAKVLLGQQVLIKCNATGVNGVGEIIYIAPFGHANQTTTVRVLLENRQHLLVPGHFITAEINLSETDVPLVVRSEAVQIIEGRSVVFVKNEQGFEPRPVILGRTDGRLFEVLDGLSVGESYVTKNSFALKSELGKGETEHAH